MKKTFFVTIFNVVVILYPIEGQKKKKKKKRTSNLSSILLHFFLLKYERKKKNHYYNINSYSTTKVLMLPLLAVLLKVLFFLFIKSKKNRKEKKRLSRAFMFQGICEYYIKNAKRSRREKKNQWGFLLNRHIILFFRHYFKASWSCTHVHNMEISAGFFILISSFCKWSIGLDALEIESNKQTFAF